MQARIAVIVPVYNPGIYLTPCVDSILAQTYTDYELILVDDGSTDGSGTACDAYADKDARVRVVHKENGGLMSAWMRGVRESTAPYLFYVDSDDWVDEDALERLVQGLTQEPIRQIICAGCMIEREWNHTRTPEGNAAPAGVYEGERLQTEIKSHLLGNETRRILPSRCMKLIDRRLIEDNMHYCDPSIRMGEDLNIMAPALLDAERVVILEDAYIYHYRYVAASMVHGYDAGLYENVKRLIEIMRQVMRDKGITNAEEQVGREFVYLFLLTLKNEIRRTGVPDAEVRSRIKDLCERENSRALLDAVQGRRSLQGGANRLLASIMEHPSDARIWAVRRVFLIKG